MTSTSSMDSLAEQLRAHEQLVLDMKTEVLDAYNQRCLVTQGECANLHLDACRSRLPSGECTSEDISEVCGTADCGMIRDYRNPTVRLPESVAVGENLNPTDGNAIETICYSVLLNGPLRDLYARASAVGSNAVYFGAWTGVFRYFPGFAQDECGSYDPRIRPWYVAASSGPKDVVIVVDVSGSMGQHNRLELAKDAAVTVINTLGSDSYVNVVVFSEEARVLSPNSTALVNADAEHVSELVNLVNDLEIDLANVATNFGSAFETTFNLLDASRATTGLSSGCQTAIVFLTDGQRTVGATADETIAMIESRNVDIGAQVFSYSLGTLADKLTAKQIACDTGGIYEHVEDGGDLSQAMAFFYRFYAMGLGENENFVALTDIYSFATGGDLGFTIAAPVYDKKSVPPAFLGVVAMDFKVSTFKDLGYTLPELRDALDRRNEGCPELALTECQRQVFRGSISTLSVCDSGNLTCSGVGSLEPVRCMAESEYPADVWRNVDHEEYEYPERVCCSSSNFSADVVEPTCEGVMESYASGLRGAGSNFEAANIGVGLAAAVLGGILLVLGTRYCLKSRTSKDSNTKVKSRNHHAVAEAVGPPQNAPMELEAEGQ